MIEYKAVLQNDRISKQIFCFLFFVSECTLLLLEFFFGKNHVANVQKTKHPQATNFFQ
jgi:hypothetical protein